MGGPKPDRPHWDSATRFSPALHSGLFPTKLGTGGFGSFLPAAVACTEVLREQGGQRLSCACLLAPYPAQVLLSLDSEASLCGQLLAGRMQRAWGAAQSGGCGWDEQGLVTRLSQWSSNPFGVSLLLHIPGTLEMQLNLRAGSLARNFLRRGFRGREQLGPWLGAPGPWAPMSLS